MCILHKYALSSAFKTTKLDRFFLKSRQWGGKGGKGADFASAESMFAYPAKPTSKLEQNRAWKSSSILSYITQLAQLCPVGPRNNTALSKSQYNLAIWTHSLALVKCHFRPDAGKLDGCEIGELTKKWQSFIRKFPIWLEALRYPSFSQTIATFQTNFRVFLVQSASWESFANRTKSVAFLWREFSTETKAGLN